MIISRKEHEKYMESYHEFKKETKRLMNLIVNKHAKIGIHDAWEYGSYFPCEYVETIDEEYGVIKVYEPSINTYHTVYATGLYVEEQ